MTFTDQIIAGIRSHTGLHYVPSFNDLVSVHGEHGDAA